MSDVATTFPAHIPHRSIIISKLHLPEPQYQSKFPPYIPSNINQFNPVATIHRSYHRQTPFLDPMFGMLDRIMDDLMTPILNRPYKHLPLKIEQNSNTKSVQPLNEPIVSKEDTSLKSNEDSSLKSWIQKEDKLITLPMKNDIGTINQSGDNLPTEGGADDSIFNEENPEYKNDLWKIFEGNRMNRSENSKLYNNENNSKRIEKTHQTSNNNNNIGNSDWLQSDEGFMDGPLINRNNNEESKVIKDDQNINEDAWWYRLISPGKPKILRDHKKSIYGNHESEWTEDKNTVKKPEDDTLANELIEFITQDKQTLGGGSELNNNILGTNIGKSHRNKTAKARLMSRMYADYDIILEVAIIGFFLSILLLGLKISVLFYREYNLSRIIRQYDYYKFTPLVRTVQRTRGRTPWHRTSPPPSYALHIPLPADKA